MKKISESVVLPEDYEFNDDKKQWAERSMARAYATFYRPAYYGTIAQPRSTTREEGERYD